MLANTYPYNFKHIIDKILSFCINKSQNIITKFVINKLKLIISSISKSSGEFQMYNFS